MKAGKLRHVIDIEYKQGNPDGYGNTRVTWKPLYTSVPAEIKVGAANETWVGDEIQSQGASVICTRYLQGIDSSMRIRFNGRTFNILSISNLLERNIELTFQCKEVIATPATNRSQSGRARIQVTTTHALAGTARIA